ncbi:feruloyl-CoA synthase [Sedimentitalea sp. JM2-8]|uniref:Feruloyl-CoA synthase n=1 Tax=Sedimentitalea xiamensis TaxID=3050037 RepID=A0ABT7F997_9RHOB|nr:feruloyl-CoA synthase [Sedimentitalea xiamensis]MDK3071674.1 feruloyl-CoA synthase [Sedimentitalea xiamensis]
MSTHARYSTNRVEREDRPDGTILLHSPFPLPEPVRTSADWLRRWAAERPDTVFLAERSGPGWRELRYRAALQQVRAVAAALLDRGLSSDTPILILSGNGIDHGVLSLAAHWVGIPTVPVAEQYSLIPGAQKQLAHIVDLIGPQLVYAEDGARFAEGLAIDSLAGIDAVVSGKAGPGQTAFQDLLRGGVSDVDAAALSVGPESVVKILMTSGSTARPKGVLTTHRMMCANQAQYERALPFLRDRPPRLVDWLPWNHVFGGSNNFNQMLANGGSLYIDGGKPVKALIAKTFENNLLMNGTIAYNVPAGFALLRDEMRGNDALRRTYFKDLDMLFYAGASLPRDVWDDLIAMATDVRGQPPLVTTCWGLTETAPACIFQHEPAPSPGILGVPLPGVVAKLVPEDLPRYEVRIKGPNVTPGYFGDPERTAESFDDEGFFKTGDAMTFVDTGVPSRGLRFDGRMSEDFKLATGIWVRAAGLRLEVLAMLAPLASDVVVTGEGRDEIGLLILPSQAVLSDAALTVKDGACLCPPVQSEIARRLAVLSDPARGSSDRICRALILSDPPSMADGEITAKGNLNFAKVLNLRKSLVDRLYTSDDRGVIRIG